MPFLFAISSLNWNFVLPLQRVDHMMWSNQHDFIKLIWEDTPRDLREYPFLLALLWECLAQKQGKWNVRSRPFACWRTFSVTSIMRPIKSWSVSSAPSYRTPISCPAGSVGSTSNPTSPEEPRNLSIIISPGYCSRAMVFSGSTTAGTTSTAGCPSD